MPATEVSLIERFPLKPLIPDDELPLILSPRGAADGLETMLATLKVHGRHQWLLEMNGRKGWCREHRYADHASKLVG